MSTAAITPTSFGPRPTVLVNNMSSSSKIGGATVEAPWLNRPAWVIDRPISGAVASHPKSLLYKKKSIADTNAIAIAVKNANSSARLSRIVPIASLKYITHGAAIVFQFAVGGGLV
jgi:hypothetical protein